MLTAAPTSFIEKIASKLVVEYESATGKKYDSTDLNCILEVLNFMGGDIIFIDDLETYFGTDEILFLKNETEFIIITDKKYDMEYKKLVFEDTNIHKKKIIFRMIWFYIEEHLFHKDNIKENAILYPKECNIDVDKLLNLISKNSVEDKKCADSTKQLVQKK